MRKKYNILILSLAVVLTGCSTNVPDLSNVDNDIMAQYMADSLLQNDKNYEESFSYDHSVLSATPTPAPTAATAAPQQSTAQPSDVSDGDGALAEEQTQESISNVSLSELYAVEGIQITGSSYSVKSSYGSKYSNYTAASGKKLLIVYFNIANRTGSSKKVNLGSQETQAQLLVDGENMGSPLHTIMDGDLQDFAATIKAGKKKQGILIFEIDKSVQVSDVQVQFTKGSSQATVSVH